MRPAPAATSKAETRSELHPVDVLGARYDSVDLRMTDACPAPVRHRLNLLLRARRHQRRSCTAATGDPDRGGPNQRQPLSSRQDSHKAA